MAFGSVAGMRKYVNKTFDIEARLGGLSDARVDPVVPLAPVLATWFWGLSRRLPSTEQVGDLLQDPRWRKRLGLKPADGGSPDTAGRILDQLSIEELNEFLLESFFIARRAGILREDGPYGLRCAIVDLNELFTSRKRHCPSCQQREVTVADAAGKTVKVTEYFHQAVALVWASGDVSWPMGFELLAPGEGEFTGAQRLLARVLPKVRASVDLVMGDALYCCRPFFEVVCDAGVEALAISSMHTEMDQELDYLMAHEPARMACDGDVALWELESTAWKQALKRPLRVAHYQRRYAAKAWKHERRELRVVTSAPVGVLPTAQGWKVGRCRWDVENGTFNLLTRDYGLTHNYRHSPAAIVALLVLRALAYCLTWAYRRFASARSKHAPRDFLRWWSAVLVEDWVRYLDRALVAANPRPG